MASRYPIPPAKCGPFHEQYIKISERQGNKKGECIVCLTLDQATIDENGMINPATLVLRRNELDYHYHLLNTQDCDLTPFQQKTKQVLIAQTTPQGEATRRTAHGNLLAQATPDYLPTAADEPNQG